MVLRQRVDIRAIAVAMLAAPCCLLTSCASKGATAAAVPVVPVATASYANLQHELVLLRSNAALPGGALAETEKRAQPVAEECELLKHLPVAFRLRRHADRLEEALFALSIIS